MFGVGKVRFIVGLLLLGGCSEKASVADVRPYAPQYALWTDGATKARTISLPAGSQIDATDPNAWQFPVGTKLTKEYWFSGKKIETRTIERTADGWQFRAFVWELPPGPWLVTVSATNTAWNGPWGTSFTANLTPDKETGLGTWTKENFVATIRNARHMGAGRPVLPPMPAPVYANLTDEDLGAVFDYLQTVPAISNKVPAPRPPKAAPVKAAK